MGFKGVSLGMLFQDLKEFGHFIGFGEVAAGNAKGAHGLAEFLKFFLIGFIVHAIKAGEAVAFHFAGDLFVRRQHEFLNELVTFVVFLFFDTVGIALGVDVDFDFVHIEVEGTVLETAFAELVGDLPEGADMALEGFHFGMGEVAEGATGGAGLVLGRERGFTDRLEVIVLHEGEGLFVGEAFIAANDGIGEIDLLNLCFLGKGYEDGFGETILRFDETTESVGEGVGQHRYNGADEVGTVAAFLGFFVEGGAGFDVGGDVRDMDADAVAAFAEFLDGEGVVEILGIVGIDGEGKDITAIAAALAVGGAHLVRNGFGLFLDRGREGGVEIVFVENALEFGVGGVCFSEDIDDFTLGIEVSLFPFNHLDDNLIANFWEGFDSGVAGVGHDEILNDAGVVGYDVVGVASFFEVADNGLTGALEDADDADVGFFIGIVFGSALGLVAAATPAPTIEFFVILLLDPGEDMVTMHRDAGVLGVHGMPSGAFFTGIGIGDKECRAALAEVDAPADEIGVIGKAEAIFFDTGNFAGLEEAL